MCDPYVMFVSRADDGVVCEVSVKGGKRKATVYPHTEDNWVTETDSLKEAFQSTGLCAMLCAMWRGDLCFNFHNAFRLVLFLFCYVMHVCYILMFLGPLNPYWITGPSTTWFSVPAVAPSALISAPERVILGCEGKEFCRLVSVLPVINTTLGPVYPNFTRGTDGVRTDYRQALRRAASVLANFSCSHFVISPYGGMNGSMLDGLRMAFGLWLYALDHHCHPDAVSIAVGDVDPVRYGVVGGPPLPLSEPVPCDVSWDDVYNSAYLGRIAVNETCKFGGEKPTVVSYVRLK
ncbi:envelope glycoprotein 48 [Colobine gammaherpesvirus 1]|uniref:Envelope glycoprotein 48 n=1 Tax=Colobine gammaherpesvirus 1 TaxID=2597325 RepID=A0A5B8G7B3_9GAMA|nr:envelope glycoprotein 48 [Colobine gammaherpesvirus 1]QDQ69235.1 envelope glycoprotein 48 [Colobine gammaherpesvirus 1]